jgi:WD40 repeat protein
VRVVAWSPDGNTVASGDADGVLRVWDVPPRVVARAKRGLRAVWATAGGLRGVTRIDGDVVGLGPDGLETLAPGLCPETAPANRGVWVCAVEAGLALRHHEGSYEVVDMATGKVRWRDDRPNLAAGALAPGARRAAVASALGEVTVRDAATGAEVAKWRVVPGRIVGVGFLDDDRLVAMTTLALTVWDVPGARLLRLMRASMALGAIALPLDRARARALAGSEHETRIVDLRDGSTIGTLEQPVALSDGAFAADGTLVATQGVDDTVRVWSIPGGRLLEVVEPGRSPSLTIDDRAGTRLVTVDFAGEIQAWPLDRDARSPADIEQLMEGCVPYRVADGELRPVALPPELCAPRLKALQK